MKTPNPKLFALQEVINYKKKDKPNWFNILCSVEERSIRDKIAHQTIIKIVYREVKPTSEKEYCHVVVKGKAIRLERFIEEVTSGVIDFCILAEDAILSLV